MTLINYQKNISLNSIVSLPQNYKVGTKKWPLLCFLHGSGECEPLPIKEALTLHGPLKTSSAATATQDFIVVAPQLKAPGGDVWHKHAHIVQEITLAVQAEYGTDPAQNYLSGFSYGGNGVLDLALATPTFWTAAWSVDPTRVPPKAIQCPLWISLGEFSRYNRINYREVLGLKPAQATNNGKFVYDDNGQDHVGSATLAYQDEKIYEWLLRVER